ncbi:TetR/AcrR family transcriptional regulator [Alicyclobacillus sp. SO9]|uniref:TetR/AcrR family transcriptional regulator n=1 Tax=Alicyclobacillus sp. SO9 TaxID=2665646 RepID=UPI0018E7CB5D|nr:TetR/AcrR family transcriptional regulator [Alicyclobacillus sp. SO9]QQE79768.1 TetR/AcrR family transcriptional regulator [Alicyclobacillus sp. SO9]
MAVKSNTRERIIQAALAAFSQNGYEGSSTREIAKRADVNEITLFRHFQNKENLFREVLHFHAPTSLLTDELDEKLTDNLSDSLTYLAQIYLEHEYKNLDYIRIGIMEVPRNPTYANIVRMIPMRLEEHLKKYLTDLSERGLIRSANYKLLARMFYAQLFQHVSMICSFGDDDSSLKQESDELVETIVFMFTSILSDSESK